MIKTEQELKAYLIQVAGWPHWDTAAEDFCVVDYSGSNVDDAFHGGHSCGQVALARSLLETFFDETVADEDD